MSGRRCPFFIFVLPALFCLPAFASFDFNSNCRNAYLKIFNLQFSEAKSLIESEKNLNPGNAIPVLLESDIDFLSAFISEEEFYYKRLLSNRERRLSMVQANEKHSPFYNYVQADIYLQCALVKAKFGEYISAANDMLKANSLLKKNQKLFPEFLLNLKGLGMIHAMSGTVPSDFKWLSALAGVEGTIEQGMSELDSLFTTLNGSEYKFLKPEAALILFYLKTNFENHESSNYVFRNDSALLVNPIVAFAISGYLMKQGNAGEAINILEHASQSGDFPFLMLQYRLGHARLCRGDKDAVEPLLKFIASFKGENYLRSAYRFIAWYYLINDDEKKYLQYIGEVSNAGSTLTDEDKDATREAKEKRIPNKKLLRARLLFDGGFFESARTELKSAGMMRDKIDSVEFNYRFARTMHAQKDTAQSISLYTKTFDEGKSLRNHFAANSALMLGMIYERRNEKLKAREWYFRCINLPKHDYQLSIGRKAKAGLTRVK